MMFQICVLFLLISFNASSAQEGGSKMRWGSKKNICPNTSLQNQTEAELLATQKKLAIDILSVDIPNLSKLGKEYIKLSKQMISGSNKFLTFMATINSYAQSVNQLNLNQKPDGCAMAAMINATVDFYKYNKKEPMQKALKMMENQVEADIGTVSAKAQIASGCCKPGTPTSINKIKMSHQPCFNNGYTYKFDEIWQLRGGILPNDFQCVVSKMYKCNNFVDNFLALIATYALTPLREMDRTATISLSTPVELVSLQMGPILPKCCCKEFLHKLDELTEQTIEVTGGVLAAEVAIFSESDVCCKMGYK